MRNDNLRRLEVLFSNPSLGDTFMNMVFPNGGNTKTNQTILRGAISGGIASEELVNKLERFVPIVYKINGTLFLKGAVGEMTYDENSPLTELFDMSEEMKSGDSYSIYVSGTDYFAYADSGETEMVKNFLTNLYAK